MKAFLLAVGKGTRLRPLTDRIPKCLVPIRETPLLQIWLEYLDRHGLEEVLINIQHHAKQVEDFVEMIYQAYSENRQVFIFGNGGSAATASHFCCDLSKGAAVDGKPRLRVMSLNDNVALLTAYANDNGYENVFVEQLKNFLQQGDLVICITGSGNSPNVLSAIEFANKKGGISIGFLGFDGGIARLMVAEHITMDNYNYGQVEDLHMLLAHSISQCFREWVVNGGKPQEIPQVITRAAVG